ncbi:hypothetical protein FNU79_18540 [Deinococcus detaillensis]|uniref:Uncharacterized protein n=1 Tax=Deinococcus detaillensis TaxID=2592048 RepID=A0A553UFG2_9DEIO|nr:hypothetical protein [Deinococcus detaillensis]TSA78953.1 hypothetical protein FNU79_18540 [Deinococcus detaillensis]
MRFELISTLEKLREVYQVPRGPARFQAYVSAAVGDAQQAEDVALSPLVSANPMASENVLAWLETWLSLGAETLAREVLEESNTRFEAVPFARPVKVGLAVLDDLGGGWTNRAINDAARFQVGRVLAKTGWVNVNLWTSQAPSPAELRLCVLEAAHRAAYTVQHGDPVTLAAMLAQEGLIAASSGRRLTLDADDLAYSRSIIAPHLESTHQPTVLACFYGDDVAREWGYPPLGLSQNAGYEVGLADTLAAQVEITR